MDYATLTAPLPKPFLSAPFSWPTVNATTMNADLIVAGAVDFKTIETSSLTLIEQVSVPNPAVGSQVVFVASSNNTLSTQDSFGNTLAYVPVSGATMTGPLSSIITSNLLDRDDNGNLNLGSISTGFNNVIIGGDNDIVSGSNEIIIGSNNGATAQYDVCIGNRCSATQFGSTSIGGGNTGITNHNTSSVAIGNDMTLGAGSNCVALGQSAGVGAVSEAIAIGYQAVNNISNSCLLGDTAIVNIRPNNASTCDLGSTAAPFKTAWLRDAVPASGCKYSQYADVTVTNTVVETSLATGLHVGSLVASANASLGTVYRFRLGCSWSGNLTDSATLRIKTNGASLIAVVMGPSNTVTEATTVWGEVVVANGGNAKCLLDYTIDGVQENIVRATSAYDPTIVNTFDVSIQWSGADVADVFVCNYFYVETLFAQ